MESSRPRVLPLVLATALVLLLPLPHAQGGPGAYHEPVGPEISLHFKGGTLAQYLEEVRKACPSPLNIVPDARALEFQLHDAELLHIAVSAALEVIPTLAVNEPSQLRIDRIFDQNNAVIYTVTFIGDKAAQSETLVLSLNLLVEDPSLRKDRPMAISPDFFQKAVGAMLETGYRGTALVEMEYDAASGIFTARGTPQQIRAIREVAAALGVGPKEALLCCISLASLVRRNGQTEPALDASTVVKAVREYVAKSGYPVIDLDYDPNTYLLTARGTPKQIEAIHAVVNALGQIPQQVKASKHAEP